MLMPSRPPTDRARPRERVERLRGRKAVEVRKRRMARTDGLCERCDARGLTVFATVVDHIKPLALGGTDEDSNTRNLCDPCHAEATAEQFGMRTARGIGRDGRPTSPDHPWNRPDRT
ncbi:hypothetical protein GCM10007897_15010 [Sphingobium jiangsuense]|nr:hypothetical protein GCM10007897_15010 [Sphingobium jiangsuense]